MNIWGLRYQIDMCMKIYLKGKTHRLKGTKCCNRTCIAGSFLYWFKIIQTESNLAGVRKKRSWLAADQHAVDICIFVFVFVFACVFVFL